MSLASLAQFAAGNRVAATKKKKVYELTVEEARAVVTIVDGNRKEVTDGSQALTLKLSRRTLSLDAVVKGTNRILASEDSVEEFTGILQAAIDDGSFDEAIQEALTALTPKVIEATETTTDEPFGEGQTPTEDVAGVVAEEAADPLLEGLDLSGIE